MSILSRDDISIGLDSMIEGLNYNFFSIDGKPADDTQELEEFVLSLEPEKMKRIMEAKSSSFNSAKKILNMWMSSPDAPKKEVARDYIERIVYAGDSALDILRSAYIMDIDYSKLDAHKHDAAIKAKPLILESVFDLEKDLRELREKLESDDLSLAEREFRVGYPERFGKGEFYPTTKYHQDWYNQDEDAVRVCPFSTSGKIIELEKLKIQLPEIPKDKSTILFSDLPKAEQYWRRLDVPSGITPDNADLWDAYIKEEFRKRREGVWFMNNGEPTYLTGNHYFAMQWCKMLDTGGYMNYRHAQANMFYHLEACIVDERCLGQLFVKSRRTGFTYVILCIMLNASTGTRNNNFGITSKSDADAKKAFLKYRYMLLNIPFFFMPLIKGKLDSPKEFEFASPLSNTRETKKSKNIGADEYLNNLVDYQPTKDDSYDGQAIYQYLGDECFFPETKVLTPSGFTEIKNLNVGDLVTNGQGKSVEIAKVYKGLSNMYEVVQPYGKSYVVSENHRLLLEQGNDKKSTKEVIMTPLEYLGQSDYNKKITRRKVFKGFYGGEHKINLDPYVLGAWLGDGSSKATQFVFNRNNDKKLYEYINKYLIEKLNLTPKTIENSDKWFKVYYSDIKSKGRNKTSGEENTFKSLLTGLGVWGNKHIPIECYKMSREDRFNLLAGIIDTDGYLANSRTFEIGMSREGLIKGIYKLAKELGLDTSEVYHKKSNYNTDVFTVRITDYRGEIPCKEPRKRAIVGDARSRRGKIKSINPLGKGVFIGIQLKVEEDSERQLILEDYTLSLNCGKWRRPNDYINHFGQISPTMLEGGEVVGKAFIGSTVGAMAKGGEQFEKMYQSSDVTKRNEITQMTASGLYSYFLPAQENMSSFTDIYGTCHKERPTKTTKNIKGKLILVGAVEFLISQEEAKRIESDRALNEQYRAFPRIIEHAFRDESGEGVFNKTKLYEQIEHNKKQRGEVQYTVGNFEWVGAIDGDVEFQPNPHGRFKVSWMPSVVDNTKALQNRVRESNGKYYPLNTECVRFGCDPFSYKSTHGKGSKGSIHGKTIQLPEGGAPSNVFVVEYIARPPDETTFFEDVIKVVRFYGAPILIESNRLDLLRHMRNRGYRGFCIDRMDKPKSKLNSNELEYGGQMMAGKDMLDSHMAAIGTWIQNYVGIYQDKEKELRPIGEMGEMPFNETLTDWLKFQPDARTEYDATISSGLAIMACSQEKYKGKEVVKKTIDISGLLPKFGNKGSISNRR